MGWYTRDHVWSMEGFGNKRRDFMARMLTKAYKSMVYFAMFVGYGNSM
jgi:hypothetical protein